MPQSPFLSSEPPAARPQGEAGDAYAYTKAERRFLRAAVAGIRTLLVIGATWLYMLLAAIPGLPWFLLTRRLEFIYAEARFGLRLLFRLAGVRVRVSGREHLPTGAAVYMANHQSNLDPPLLIGLLPGCVTVLAKKELFRVPVLGFVMRLGGVIRVDRAHREAAQASVRHAAEVVRGGRPLLIFPEGTRSPDGRLLPFKKGPFFLAEAAAVPVVPVRLDGTGKRMRKGSLRIQPGEVRVTILPPLDPRGFADREALSAAVREQLDQAPLGTHFC